MRTSQLARQYIETCLARAGSARGICLALAAIAHANLYRSKSSGSEADHAAAHKYAREALDHAGDAPGICAGLAAIALTALLERV